MQRTILPLSLFLFEVFGWLRRFLSARPSRPYSSIAYECFLQRHALEMMQNQWSEPEQKNQRNELTL